MKCKQISKLFSLTIIAALFVSFISCKKDSVKLTPLASLNITNAIVGGTTAKFGSRATTISNNNYTQYSLLTGNNSLYIYPSTDSLHPYYTYDKFNVNQSDIYSLFLAGTSTAVDAVLVKDTIPYRTDSTAGIRFINLSPNSTPLNITLSTSTGVNEVSNLAYKQITSFISYPALYNSTYTFQVRDASNPNTVLTSVSFTATTVPRFANVTLVIRGNTATGIITVKNDR